VLAAENQTQARRGALFAAFLKLLPLFIFVVPGLVAYILAQQGRLSLPVPDQALPALVIALLPSGWRGIVVAGLLAALMSSLSSVFNSCSTLITWDVYRKLRPDASERQLVWVGRVSTAFLVVLGLLWIPLMKLISGQIYQYLQSVQAYISPPIAAVFLIGILSRRVNARGAMAALLTGLVIGTARLIAELNKHHLDGFLLGFAEINFLHFALFLFVLCSVVLVLVSATAPPPAPTQIEGLTFGGTAAPAIAGSARDRRIDILVSAILVACVVAIWLYF
jgi:SSS family solute:Na+ symporter